MATDKRSDFNEKDAAQLTGVEIKEVERAWHDARDAAQALGDLPERVAHKARDVLWANKLKHDRDKVYVLRRQLVIHSSELAELERIRAPLYHTIINRLRVLPGIDGVLVLPE